MRKISTLIEVLALSFFVLAANSVYAKDNLSEVLATAILWSMPSEKSKPLKNKQARTHEIVMTALIPSNKNTKLTAQNICNLLSATLDQEKARQTHLAKLSDSMQSIKQKASDSDRKLNKLELEAIAIYQRKISDIDNNNYYIQCPERTDLKTFVDLRKSS